MHGFAARPLVSWPILLCLLLAVLAGTRLGAQAPPVDFNRQIRPLFNKHCIVCHGGVSKKSGFSLLFEEEAFAPAKSGQPAIRRGDPEQSELIRRITSSDPDERMPAEADPLAPAEIDLLTRWVEQGAGWARHWAYIKPFAAPNPGATRQTGIDHFVGQQLRAAGLDFSPAADRPTLIRRLSLDLIGLPPSPEEVDAFLNDRSPDAYGELVDRLLASPRFGERWAAMWLDLARYADTQGYEKDNRRHIWLYRDWVIRAFNSDLPFDQFTIEQLAGDLLQDASDEQRVATGFHRNTMTNTEGGTDDEEFRVAAVIDRINTTWEVWMGTSFGCVQCHSHPYDPFRHREYYQFMAFFNNTADADRSDDQPRLEVLSPEQKERIRELDEQIATLKRSLTEISTELRPAFNAWSEGLATISEPRWIPLRPSDAQAGQGGRLDLLEDDSILATGPVAEENVYTLRFESPPEGITALRLEVLPHESLPKQGPGQADNGNFVLTELEVYAGDQRAPLVNATADYEQTSGGHNTPYGKWSAYSAIDGDHLDPKAGWAIGGQIGQPHTFIVETQSDLTAAPLRIVLQQKLRDRHSIGRFRLSATTSPRPVRADLAALEPIRAVLAKPEDQRSEAETGLLTRRFLAETPRLDEARRTLVAKEKERTGIRGESTLVLEELPQGKRRKTQVFERGNWMVRGQEVKPALPAIFIHDPADQPRNRLELAQWMVSPENPLTARVVVNRFWEQLFGRGLVETLEDFGSRGEPPTHRPLLDWLALEFQNTHQWSVNGLLRQIVLSRTYRQSSHLRPGLLERDPYNRLLARGPRFRLPAETIRDQALAIAGLLSDKLYGPSVMPPQPDGVWQVVYNGEEWRTSAGEDRYRRALYTYWRRTSPYPSLMAFDAPSREFCTSRRIRTNTPLAALVTLNDSAFIEAAQGLAERMIREGGSDLEARLRRGFRLVQAKPPSRADLEELTGLYHQALAHFAERPGEAKELASESAQAALTVVANVLLNLDATVNKE